MPSAADSRVGRNETSHHLHNVCSRDVSGHTKDGRERGPCYGGAVLGDVRSDVGQHAGVVPPNRMMADLDALKEQTARILEVLEEREDVGSKRKLSRSPPHRRQPPPK